MRVSGSSLTELVDLGDVIAAASASAVRRVLLHAARDVGSTPSVDDLTRIRVYWDKTVDETLMPLIERAYRHGVDAVRQDVTQAVDNLTAAADDTSSVPVVTNPHTEAYLSQARNRMVNVGNETWEHARGALIDGLHEGEGTTQLARRVANSADVAIPRAEVVARTEVNGAANAGAFDQMTVIGLPGTTKEWIATGGNRTRPTHAAADGQTVPLDGKFTVGGWPMDRPHDPSAPASEVVNCRCTIGFDIPDDEITALVPTPSMVTDYVHATYSRLDDWDFNDLPQFSLAESRNAGLLDMMKRQGFVGRPKLVSADELDELVANGATKIYRGLRFGSDGRTATDYVQDYKMADEPFTGRGVFGNGTYFSTAEDEALDYAGRRRDDMIVGVLRSDARVLDFADLVDMIKNNEQVRALVQANPTLMSDPSRIAVALGYDAIRATTPKLRLVGTQYVQDDVVQYVVLNRTATAVLR